MIDHKDTIGKQGCWFCGA